MPISGPSRVLLRSVVAMLVAGQLLVAPAAASSYAATAQPGAATAHPDSATAVPLVPLRTVSSPGAVVDTMASDLGRPGIRIGARFYPAPYLTVTNGIGGYSGTTSGGTPFAAQWQVLVLSPKDLSPVWNRSYSATLRSSNTSGNRSPVSADLAADLAKLKTGPQDLVIATSHSASGWASGRSLEVFSAIGYQASPAAAQAGLVAGGFSIIGNVNRTDSWAQYKWGATAGSGRIDDLLVLDQYMAFRHVPNHRVDVDTRLSNGCDPAGTNCVVHIRVGDPANDVVKDAIGGAGYAVAVYDKITLAPVRSDFFFTNGPDANSEAVRMTNYLNGRRSADNGDIVVITSVRNPGDADHNSLLSPNIRYPVVMRLAEAVAAVGGTENGFNRGSSVTGSDYTLVGWADKSTPVAGQGSEAFGANARVRTVLAPNEFSLFRPTGPASAGAPEEDLQRLALSAPTGTWPVVSGAALRYIGVKLGLGPDPRAAYWATDHPASYWHDLATDVAALTYSAVAKRIEPFTEAQFAAARDEFVKELTWVSIVRERLASYAAPFASLLNGHTIDNSTTLIADLIAEDNEKDVEFDWQGLMKALVAIIAPFLGEAGHALHVAAGIVELGAWIGETAVDKPPSYESITIKANKVTDQLDKAAVTAIAMVDRVGDLLVSDYTKLSTVAGKWCVDTSLPESWCSAGAKAPEAAVFAAMQRANERYAWTQLTPVAYGAYDLGRAPFTDLSKYGCGFGGFYHPFTDAPDDAQAVLRRGSERLWGFDQAFSETEPWTDETQYQYFIMGKQKSYSPPYAAVQYPSPEILERMFGPVLTDDNNPGDGGLGISKEAFIPTLPHNYTNGCDWPI